MPELLHPGVYAFEVSSGVRPIEGVSTSTAAFVGVADKGPIPGTTLPNGRAAQPVMVTSMTEYFRRFGSFRPDSFLTYAVRAFYENGGRRLYIVRVAPTIPATATTPAKVTATCATGAVDNLQVSAANEGKWGNAIWVRIAASSNLEVTPAGVKKFFTLQVLYGEKADDAKRNIVESFEDLAWESEDPRYAVTVINSRSEYIAITKSLPGLPKVNFEYKADGFTPDPTKDNPKPLGQSPREAGKDADGGSLNFIGDAATDSKLAGFGLRALDKVTDVNMIAIPGRGDLAGRGMEYCKNERALNDAFFIGDVGTLDPTAARSTSPPVNPADLAGAVDFGQKFAKAAGDYGAVYFPWVWSTDPRGSGPNPRILLPPSGFLAGIYARTDNSRGVFKAPAGTEAGVAGALDVATAVSDTEQDRLNPIGINVVRTVPTAGIVVWGTRTIGNNAEWRYIPVRRMAIFLRVSIYYGIQWAVFEPNDEPLWASLRLNVRAFMLTQFRAGAFQGGKPDDAFFVRCDATTTTQQDIDNGVVNILVGFAPLKPAEFVVLKLSQKVNQPAA